MELDIIKTLTISMYHITRKTYEALLNDGARNKIMLPVYVKGMPNDSKGCGLYIYIERFALRGGNIPEDLMFYIDLAVANDCGILCLDIDGPELEDYKIYEW